MDTVGDDSGDCGTRRERRGDDAGIAMVQRAHRIEQMREHPGAGVDAGVRLVERRVGMADGDDHVARGQTANRVESARQFGRESDQPKRVHREHSLEGVAARLEVERGMRAQSERREIAAASDSSLREFSNALAIES